MIKASTKTPNLSKTIISVSSDKHLIVWGSNFQPKYTFEGNAEYSGIISLKKSKLILASKRNGEIDIFTLKPTEIQHMQVIQTDGKFAGKLLELKSGEIAIQIDFLIIEILNLDNLITPKCRLKLIGHKIYINCIMEDTNSRIITGSCDMTIKIWDQNTGECLNSLIHHGSHIYSILQF